MDIDLLDLIVGLDDDSFLEFLNELKEEVMERGIGCWVITDAEELADTSVSELGMNWPWSDNR